MIIRTRSEAEWFVGSFHFGTVIPMTCGIDTETEGIDPRKEPAAGPKGRIVCWTFAWPHNHAILVWHNEETAAVFRSFLEKAPVVGHNIYGFDSHMFRKAGIPLGNIVGDTLRVSQLINPDDDAEHGLKALMKYRLGWKPVGEFEELFKRRRCVGVEREAEETAIKKRKVGGVQVPTLVGGAHSRLAAGYETVPLSEIPTVYPHLMDALYEYATLDAKATLALWQQFNTELKNRPWTPPLSQHSGTPPATLLREWKPPGATSTPPAVRPRTPGQPPICMR